MSSAPNDDNEVDIRCPNCSSTNVSVCEDSQGHFQITKCYKCGYSNECKI